MANPWERDWSAPADNQTTANPWERDWSNTNEASQKPIKKVESQSLTNDAIDFGKRISGSVISGLASIPKGVESAIRYGVRANVEGGAETVMPSTVFNPAIDSDETVFGPESQADKDKRMLAGARAAASVPAIPFSDWIAKKGLDAQKSINNSTSQATQKAIEDSQITGNIFKGEMDFGKNPNARGYIMQAADVFGSMLPIVASALVTKNSNVGAVIGGGMAAGEGAQSAKDFLDSKSDDELKTQSPYFARLLNAGATTEEARRLTILKAGDSAAALQGVMAMAGDKFTGSLITGRLDDALSKAAGKSIVAKSGAGVALSSAEQGVQEVGEGVASDIGLSSVVPSKEIGEDSAANLVLGAMGGAPVGLIHRSKSNDNTRADTNSFDTSGTINPQANQTRLNQLSNIAQQRDLTPQEQQEALSLLNALSQSEITNQTNTGQTSADTANSASIIPDNAEAAPKPVSDFWSFAADRGYKPGDIEIGTPEHAALKAEYDAAKAGTPAPLLPPLNDQADPDLQNRNRGRDASVNQMSSIARTPDYMRLGPSRTPDSGAPMVFAVGDVLETHIEPDAFGRQDIAVMSDGQRVPFRYAVVNAETVQPSNFANGSVNPEFSGTQPGTLKALNNGRVAGLRAAYQMRSTDQYRQEFIDDQANHGISSEVISRVPNPILVRVYSESSNTAGMAAKSQAQGLGMSAAELARQDSGLIDSEVISQYRGGDITSADNRDFVRSFVGKLIQAGQDIAGLMTANGQLSQDGRKRIQAAMVQNAYGDSDMVEEMFDSTDTDIKAIGEALKTMAGQWANMRDSARLGAINPDVDITDNLIQAVNMIRRARRDKISLYDLVQQPDLMTGEGPDTMTVAVLRLFYDGQYFTRAIGKDKVAGYLQNYVTAAMATSPDAGMFGDLVTPMDILASISPLIKGNTNEQQNQSPQGSEQPTGGLDLGSGTGQRQQRESQPDTEAGGNGLDQSSRAESGQNADTQAGQQNGQGDQEVDNTEPVLTSPTRQDVIDQQDKADKADKLDEQEQVRRESEAGAASFNLTTDEGRQDTTGNLFEPNAPNIASEPQPSYNAGYETDLFGDPLPNPPRTNIRGRTGSNARAEVVQRSTSVSTDTQAADTQAPNGDYYARTIVGKTTDRKIAVDRINSAADAALATKYLYKSAVERLDGIVSDKDGKPLAIVGGFKGALAEASIYPSTLVGEAIRVPGAAFIWFSHNHPSGKTQLSQADIRLSGNLSDIFRGSGIEPKGLLAVSDKEFNHIDQNSKLTSGNISDSQQTNDISIPVIERELAPKDENRPVIDSPTAANIFAKMFYSQANYPGIMLLDSQSALVAWVPIPSNMRGRLRDTGGLNAIYRAVSESNAATAILVHGGELDVKIGSNITAGQNIAAALKKIGVYPLDSINALRNTSAASNGQDIANGPVLSRANYTPEFFSQLQRSIEQSPPKLGAMIPAQWIAWLDANGPKMGVKKDEIEWSGIKDWLGLQTGKVSKDEIIEYLKESGVKVEETMLGELSNSHEARVNAAQDLRDVLDAGGVLDDDAQYAIRTWINAEPGSRIAKQQEALIEEKLKEAGDLRSVAEFLDAGSAQTDKTKYAQYTLPGGENYREVLLTLPVRKAEQYTLDNVKTLDPNHPIASRPDLFWYFEAPGQVFQIPKSKYAKQSDARDYIIRDKQPEPPLKNNYRSSHWDPLNVLAHIRLNDRIDADGNKVLFIEEIQSDWGQDGKKKGFKGKTQEDAKQFFGITDSDWAKASAEDREAYRLEMLDAKGRDVIPAAPFVTKTEGWLNLALKRVMMMAVEGGYDKVAFTDAEPHFKRWGTERIEWSKQPDGSFLVRAKSQEGGDAAGIDLEAEAIARGLSKFNSKIVRSAKDLEKAIEPVLTEGQNAADLAPKIWNRMQSEDAGVSMPRREGFEAFYGDKNGMNPKTGQPSFLLLSINSLLKKTGGGKLEKTSIQTRDNRLAVVKRDDGFRIMDLNANIGKELINGTFASRAEAEAAMNAMMRGEQPGFAITDAMRETVGQGLPLFSRQQQDAPQPLPVSKLNAMVKRIKSKMPNMPEVVVVTDPADMKVPDLLLYQINHRNAWYDVEGAMHNGKLYLFASGLTNMTRAEHVLANHEAAHYGLSAMLGNKRQQAMQLIFNNNPEIRQKAKLMQENEEGKLSEADATEEILVEMSKEELVKLKGWRKVVMMMRDFLNDHGFENMAKQLEEWLSGNLTEQEKADLFVADLVISARKWVADKNPNRQVENAATVLSRLSRQDQATLSRQQRLDADAVMLSRASDTKAAYETRIDELFAGDMPRSIQKGQDAALVLDASDILDLLKEGLGPVILNESAVRKPEKGQLRGAAPRHPNMTAAQWKKVPDWLDNPAAVFASATIEGDLVFVAPELVNGSVVLITLNPKAQGGSRKATVRLLTNAYDKDESMPPFSSWLATGKARYINKKEFPAVLRRFGLQLPETAYQNKPGTIKILNEKNLAGYRKEQGATDSDIRFSRASPQSVSQRAQQLMQTPPAKRPGVIAKTKQAARDLVDNMQDPQGKQDLIDGVIHKLQDRFVDLKWLQEQIRKAGGTLSELNDAYRGEELYQGRAATAQDEFLTNELKPLIIQMRQFEIGIEQLEAYLHAQHAPEANAELAKRNLNAEQLAQKQQDLNDQVNTLTSDLQHALASGLATKAIEQSLTKAREELSQWSKAQAFKGTEEERLSLSGMSDEEAAAIMDAVPTNKQAVYKSLAQKVSDITANTREIQVKTGLITRAQANEWAKLYQHYVPLHRDEAHPNSRMRQGQGFSIKGKESRSRTGSNAQVTNILAHVAAQRELAITRSEKNLVAKRLWLLAAQNPMADVWTLEIPRASHIDAQTGLVVTGVDPTYLSKPNVLSVKIAGIDNAIVFNERNERAMRLVGELKNLDAPTLDGVTRVAAKLTRYFASINTQYNPVFGVINFARDVQAAGLQISTTKLQGKQREIMQGALPAMRAIWQDARGKTPAGKQGTELIRLWKEMQAAGGMTGYREIYTSIEDRVKALDKMLAEEDRGKLSKAARAGLDLLNDYNTAMEGAVRLSAYKQAKDMGMSVSDAASLAKNLTVNFNRKGTVARAVAPWYAFFNASVQGSTRMIETLRGPMGKKIVAGGVLLGMATSLMSIAMMGGGGADDDEDKQTPWQKIPDFVKEKSLILGYGEDYIAVPMPLGYNIFTNAGRVLAEQMSGQGRPGKGVAESMLDILSMAIGAFNPVGGTDVASAVTPTPVDWAVDLLRNKDWTGRDIAILNRNSNDKTPGHARAKDSATPWAKAISRGANWVTGGTDYVAGVWSPTPDQIDYVIGQLTGGVGREAGKMVTTLASPFTADELPANKIPLISRVYGNTRSPKAGADLFYENVKKANDIENEVQGRLKDGKSVEDISRESFNLIGEGNAAEAHVKKLRMQRKHVVSEAAEGYKDRVKLIDEQIGKVMDDFNRQVNKERRMEAEKAN